MQMPELLDNVSKTVKDDLMVTIKKWRQAVHSGGMFFYIRIPGPQETT